MGPGVQAVMGKYFVALVFCFGLIERGLGVNIIPCDDLPEIQEFSRLLEQSRHCKIDSDCIVQQFGGHGNSNGYGIGAPINKHELSFLLKKSKSLPSCSHG